MDELAAATQPSSRSDAGAEPYRPACRAINSAKASLIGWELASRTIRWRRTASEVSDEPLASAQAASSRIAALVALMFWFMRQTSEGRGAVFMMTSAERLQSTQKQERPYPIDTAFCRVAAALQTTRQKKFTKNRFGFKPSQGTLDGLACRRFCSNSRFARLVLPTRCLEMRATRSWLARVSLIHGKMTN